MSQRRTFVYSFALLLVASTAVRGDETCAANAPPHASAVLGPKASNICPEGYDKLTSEATCRAAIRLSGFYGEDFGYVVNRKDRPSGCYRFGTSGFYFNKHASGGKKFQVAPTLRKVHGTAPRENRHRLFVGDSDIDLWDVNSEFPDAPYYNVGFSGYTCEDVAGEIDMWLSTFTPDRVVLVCGENDLGDRSAAATFAFFKQIVEKANEAGAQVLYLGTKPEPATKDLHADYRAYDALIRAHAVTLAGELTRTPSSRPPLIFIDVYASFETLGNGKELYADDRLHLSDDKGYAYWSTWTQAALSEKAALCYVWKDGACEEQVPSGANDCTDCWSYCKANDGYADVKPKNETNECADARRNIRAYGHAYNVAYK